MAKQILGEGPQQADLVLIGEAAGAEEEQAGRPFVGPAGKELDRLLSDAGIDRSAIYITNLVKEHPPGNHINPWIIGNELTAFGVQAAAVLQKEVEGRKPLVVVCLGASPTLGFAQETRPITKIRGAPLVKRLGGRDIIVVPTLHPAFILRGAWMDRYLLASDLRKAKAMAEAIAFGDWPIPVRNLIVNPSFDDAISYIHQARQADEIGFDIETSGEACTCFSIALSPTSAISISPREFTPQQGDALWEELGELLSAEDGPRIVTQNGNYDTSFLKEYYAIHTNLTRVEDTMCAHHVMLADLGGDEKEGATGFRVKRSSKSLALLASLYTNEPFYKDEGGKARESGDFRAYKLYNAKDAAITLECWQTLAKCLAQRPGMDTTYRSLTMARLPAIQAIQSNGILVDARRYRTLRRWFERRCAALDKRLQNEVAPYLQERRERSKVVYEKEVENVDKLVEAERAERLLRGESKRGRAGENVQRARKSRDKARSQYLRASEPFNSDSDDQCAEFFYSYLKLPKRVNRKTKAVTVDDEALAEFARPAYNRPAIPAAETIRKIRELRQVLETFLAWELKNGRFHAAFNLRGTKFGRMSSSKLFFRYGGNQQNIPPAVRACMIADAPFTRK